MRLRAFSVRGYKNLTTTVELTDLEAINVLHGPNNVGKSNLLEAMDLFFELLGFERDGWLPIAEDRRVTEAEMDERGFSLREIFNLASPAPIEMEARITIEPGELEQAGIRPLLDATEVTISLELAWRGGHGAYRIRSYRFGDGTDAAAPQSTPERKAWVLRFTIFLNRSFIVRGAEGDRFVRIGTARLATERLALQLYDAKESPDLELAQRWERFVDAMREFAGILGEGRFIVTYDRKAGAATLYYETPAARVPLHLLGSGVRQVVAVLGHILVNSASIVAIEEPELNLRYPLQEQLRDALARTIVGAPGGPSQLFIASHSPAFETRDKFYWMLPGPRGPHVEVRARADAALALEIPPAEDLAAHIPIGAARCYLSSEGFVRVPSEIREALGLPQGGGVMFLPGDESVEMLSDERFLRRLGEGDDDP